MFDSNTRQPIQAGKKSDFHDISLIARHCTITRLEKYDTNHTLIDFTCNNQEAVKAALKLLRQMGDTLARYDKKRKAWIIADVAQPRVAQFLPIGEYAMTRINVTLRKLGS